MPEQGRPNTVSLYVAKALDMPGIVCARVINGFDEGIHSPKIRLQRWENGRLGGLWGKGQDLETLPRSRGPEFSVGVGWLVRAVGDWRLPRSGQPAPAGRYRVCLSYLLPAQEKYQEVCSEEFLLP